MLAMIGRNSGSSAATSRRNRGSNSERRAGEELLDPASRLDEQLRIDPVALEDRESDLLHRGAELVGKRRSIALVAVQRAAEVAGPDHEVVVEQLGVAVLLDDDFVI